MMLLQLNLQRHQQLVLTTCIEEENWKLSGLAFSEKIQFIHYKNIEVKEWIWSPASYDSYHKHAPTNYLVPLFFFFQLTKIYWMIVWNDAVVNSTCSGNIFPFFRYVMLDSTIFRCRNICCTFRSSTTQCGRHQGLGIWHFKQITPSIITTDLLKNLINCYKTRICISKLFKVIHTQLTEELNQKFVHKLKNRNSRYLSSSVCTWVHAYACAYND